jgi:hypothetical protein
LAAIGAEQVPSLGSQTLAWHSFGVGHTTGVFSQTPSWQVRLHLFMPHGVLFGALV